LMQHKGVPKQHAASIAHFFLIAFIVIIQTKSIVFDCRSQIITQELLEDSIASKDSNGFFHGISDDVWFHQRHIAQNRKKYKTPDNPSENMETPSRWYQNNWEPNLACVGEEMIGNMGDGHKWVCDPHRVEELSLERSAKGQSKCLVYSIGSAGQFDFEESVQEHMPSCEIHVFDHIDHISSRPSHLNISFHSWGLKPSYRTPFSAINESLPRFYRKFMSRSLKSPNFKTIHEIRRELGHESRPIDIFKIDCEGCEWFTYLDWIPLDIRQVQIEVHMTPPVAIPFFEAFHNANFAIFHKEANVMGPRGDCFEYSFIKMAPSFFRRELLKKRDSIL